MPHTPFGKLSILAFLLVLFAFSCKDDSCKKTGCGPNGICLAGDCLCDPGWTLDANGQCNVEDLCFQKNCVNGTCNPQTGLCDCEPGWVGGNCSFQDYCYQVDCGDHGQCNPSFGICECDPGYALDGNNQCNFELRGRFIGTWSGNHTDSGSNPSPAYTMTISRDPSDPTKVRFTNFMNFICSATNQPSDAVGTVNETFEEIDVFAFLCSEYDASSAFNSATMLTDNDLRIEVKVTSGFTTWNLIGVYQRQ